MKSILLILCTIGVGVLILRSEITPWRLVRATDLQRSSAPTPEMVVRRIVVPATPAQDHSGDWMHDPDYRSALERTTVVGRPETAASRDDLKRRPTSAPHHP